MRWLALIVVVAIAVAAILIRERSRPAVEPLRLTWVATARQFGPVGYRDPVGAISPDGRWIAYSEGRFLRVRAVDGGPIVNLPPGEAQIRTVAWNPDSRTIVTDGFQTRAGLATYDIVARTRRAFDPGAQRPTPRETSPDGNTKYVAQPNASGTLDLWAVPAGGGSGRQLTAFSRDTYAPSVSADGAVLFKVQSYRTVVAVSDADGGRVKPLAAFQSETPSWDPTGKWIGITFGTWRRVLDDAHYPDIAQDVGIVPADGEEPAAKPARVVHASVSEDQALCWSPNGRFIAFHSHKDQSDDIWLRPAADDTAAPVRISFLGRGAEAGWPRWSPDGRWLMFYGASRSTRRPAPIVYIAGIDQETGTVTSQPREIHFTGVDADVSHSEWLPDSAHIVVIAKDAPGRHVIFTAARDGGEARVVTRFASEHDNPGLGVSPDGRQVAYIAPAPDGYFQVFRMPIPGSGSDPKSGSDPVQVTTDPSNKTQPAWSPDGAKLAFTVWSYDAQFWLLRAR